MKFLLKCIIIFLRHLSKTYIDIEYTLQRISKCGMIYDLMPLYTCIRVEVFLGKKEGFYPFMFMELRGCSSNIFKVTKKSFFVIIVLAVGIENETI